MRILSIEQVSDGDPDKIGEQIADAITESLKKVYENNILKIENTHFRVL